ncbi:hypothetical protein, partial [Nocardia kruczakiae]|uniref:hypothetical protein n=1 Tax=Nocardia kruczakiae TaxID=261477 RepID=UPI001C3FCF5E
MTRTTAALLACAAIAGFGLTAGRAAAAPLAAAQHQALDPSAAQNGSPAAADRPGRSPAAAAAGCGRQAA